MPDEALARRIVLFGANGQVGHELRKTLSTLGTVVALDYPQVDFANPESLREPIRVHRPVLIVNAAAYTAVDKAESAPQEAFAVNGAACAVLAEEAEAAGAMLVHYSTDYVFDGNKAEPYTESDAPNPLSVYGLSKLEGERGTANCRRHLIFRTSWVIGAHGHNFLKTMLRLAAERESLRVVCDQYGAPASAALLAEVTAAIAAGLLKADADDPRWGLYHLVPRGETSWHGLACHIVARGHASGLPLKAGLGDVLPIPASEYPTPARRPQNSRLDTHKIRSTFGITLPDWRVGVDAIMDALMVQAQHDHV